MGLASRIALAYEKVSQKLCAWGLQPRALARLHVGLLCYGYEIAQMPEFHRKHLYLQGVGGAYKVFVFLPRAEHVVRGSNPPPPTNGDYHDQTKHRFRTWPLG